MQAAAVNQPRRVPLATTIQNRNEEFTKDSRLVNAIAELDPPRTTPASTKEFWVQKRVGLAEASSHTGNGLGMYNWRGNLYSVFGTALLVDGVSIGTVDGTSSYVFTEMLGTGWLVLGNGVKAYYTDGLTLVEIPTYRVVYAGELIVDSVYEIVTVGTTDFVGLGAAANTPGVQFTSTGVGDALTTGTVALVAQSLLEGVTYRIRSVGSTNFTLVGAPANTVGTVFTATGAGTGTGTVDSPNFPASFVKGWAYLNGTLYVMDSEAKIWGTATLSYGGVGGLDDPRIWDPLNMLIARIEPDQGVALIKHHTYVVALKGWTTEAFYDAANAAGSPLKPVQGAQSFYGCASSDSVQTVDGTLLWMTKNQRSAHQVARMDNLRVQIISTPPIERLLAQADPAQVFSWALKQVGHRFYGLTLKSLSLTLVYDLDQGLWYIWTDATGNYWPIVASSSASNERQVMQHETNGKVYYVEGDYQYPNDAGTVFPVDIYTPNFDGGVDRRKTLNVMHFNADQHPGSRLFVRFSDDDYQSWTNFREVNLGNKRPILTGCGTFYRRAWHFRHYANTPLRIKSVDLQLDLGTL